MKFPCSGVSIVVAAALSSGCSAPAPTAETLPEVDERNRVRVGPNVEIPSQFTGLPLVEPHVSAHPVDANRLLAAAMVVTDVNRPYESCRLTSFVSTDGGETWKETPHDFWGYDPWTEILPDGRAVLAWIGTRGSFQDLYPIALFTSGESAMHINGVWEVPTMSDLASQGKLGFEWGAIELPVFFGHACTYSDSHAFAIPNNVGKEPTPEKHAAVLEVIKAIVNEGLYWASAGHIPAAKSVTDSAEYQAMQPNATYAVLTANMVYDPQSKFAGVASPMFDAAGNAFTAAVNGEAEPADAVAEMKEALDALE